VDFKGVNFDVYLNNDLESYFMPGRNTVSLKTGWHMVYSVTGTQIYLQMAYGLTVHTSMWCLLRPEEKYSFTCTNLHKTRKYSAVLGSKLLYRIFRQIDQKDGRY